MSASDPCWTSRAKTIKKDTTVKYLSMGTLALTMLAFAVEADQHSGAPEECSPEADHFKDVFSKVFDGYRIWFANNWNGNAGCGIEFDYKLTFKEGHNSEYARGTVCLPPRSHTNDPPQRFMAARLEDYAAIEIGQARYKNRCPEKSVE